MELGHRRVVRHGKGQMDVLRGLAAYQGKGTVERGDVEALGSLARNSQAENRRDRFPEALRLRQIADADPEVVDHVVPLALATEVDGLGAVPVRVEQEAAVVVRVVLRPRPG